MRQAFMGGSILVILMFASTAAGQSTPQAVSICELEAKSLCTNNRAIVSVEGSLISSETRGPVPDAIVVARRKGEEDDPVTTVSDALGRFVFVGLKTGQYVLEIEHLRFRVFRRIITVTKTSTVILEGLELLPASVQLPPNFKLVSEPIFYVTDRERGQSCGGIACYKNERNKNGRLIYGIAYLSVPQGSRGSVSSGQLAHRMSLVTLDKATEVGRTQFWDAVDARGAAAHKVLVFIHGFDNSFESAISELAALKHDIHFDGPTILYSWASRDELGAYFEDESTISWSTLHFRRFLQLLDDQEFEEVHFIAHSMGNRLLIRGLETKTSNQPGQVIFVAPDVDADTFQEAVLAVNHNEDHFTMYASPWDQALLLSGMLHRLPRAGLLRPRAIMRGADTIDVESVDPTFVHHSYLVEATPLENDVSAVLLGDGPSSKPRASHLLKEQGNLLYWELVK